MADARGKVELRTHLLAARRSRSAHERSVAATAIADHGRSLLQEMSDGLPLLIGCYLSQPEEPGTEALLDQAFAEHDAVWVPRADGSNLSWACYRRNSAVREGRFGIREPDGPAVASEALLGLDVMFVPGIAVDRSGNRLGRGGGYYDRCLAALPRYMDGGPLLVIVLFDDEVVDAVPIEDHDCAVDMALTPSGVVQLTHA